MQSLKKIIIVASAALIAGCGISPAEGGVGGAVLGGGIGAAIGASITNGSVGNSAALGTAIGLPSGVILALAIEALNRPSGDSIPMSTITEQQKEIYRNSVEIDNLRNEAAEEAPIGNPPVANRDFVFTGATLGNPLR